MMKELYIAPELELLCLAAEERLATDLGVDFDGLMANSGEGVSVDNNIDVEVLL
jgi:hypothetical protein